VGYIVSHANFADPELVCVPVIVDGVLLWQGRWCCCWHVVIEYIGGHLQDVISSGLRQSTWKHNVVASCGQHREGCWVVVALVDSSFVGELSFVVVVRLGSCRDLAVCAAGGQYSSPTVQCPPHMLSL
jgi:hypothetical protein